MPRIVRSEADINVTIAKQLAEPTKINVNGIEYTFISDNIVVYCDDPAAIADTIETQIERPIITVGDYGYIKYVMSPRSVCKKISGIENDGETPFTYYCMRYDTPFASIDTAMSTICGVIVDKYGAVVPLPAGSNVVSILDGRQMPIVETDFAPEMIGIDTLSYYVGIAGVAKYNGAIANRTNNGVARSFHIRLEMRNEFMFSSIMNNYHKNHVMQKKVFQGGFDQLVGEEISRCKCRYQYGPVYAVYHKYNKDKDPYPRYNIYCINCVTFKTPVVVQIETGKTLQDAVEEYSNKLDASAERIERVEILRDLVSGELIRWRGELCLRGKKWFYHSNVFNALARGIAKDFPGYYWI